MHSFHRMHHHANGIPENSLSKTLKNEQESVASNHDLLPGIKELAQERFVPDVAAYFQRQSNVPVLTATNLSILERLQNPKTRKTKTPLQENRNSLANDKQKRNRPNSAEVKFNDCDDMYLIQTCWEVILSFMGDLDGILEKGQSTKLFQPTQRRQNVTTKQKILRKSNGNSGVTMRNNPVTKRPASMYVSSDLNGNHQPQISSKSRSVFPSETLRNMTVLEKVHFLANVGISTPCFRDEIFCQILKQLTSNPSPRSTALGWILLSLMLGCFPPSDDIVEHVELFLQQQRSPCSSFCLDKLARTLSSTGERKNPPCSLELQAAKSRQLIRIPAISMDHSVRTIWIDSSTTAGEMCDKLAEKNRLGDGFGFALFLALDNKLAPLGHWNFHVMDAVSQAERFSKINNVHELWRIYYRRELFSPLDSCCVGSSETKNRLTYSQICGGVQSGEHHCKKAQDLALLIAHQYCVRYGLDSIDVKNVKAVCTQALPSSAHVEGKKKKWIKMVQNTLKALAMELSRSNKQLDKNVVMEQVVRYGSKVFIENFTKVFHLATFCIVDDREDDSVSSILKINHQKMVISPTDDVIKGGRLEIDVVDLKNVEIRNERGEGSCIKLKTKNGKIYEMTSSQSDEIYEILKRYLSDLSS